MERIRRFVRSVLTESVDGQSNGKLGVFTREKALEIMHNVFEGDFYDLYPNYSKPFDEDEDFLYDEKEDAEAEADLMTNTFESLPEPIPVYRALYAEDEGQIDLDYPGESWSFDRKSAVNFGSHNGSNFLLSGTIEKRHVNWEETLSRFAQFSLGYDENENEIVVDDQSEIKNIKIVNLKWKD